MLGEGSRFSTRCRFSMDPSNLGHLCLPLLTFLSAMLHDTGGRGHLRLHFGLTSLGVRICEQARLGDSEGFAMFDEGRRLSAGRRNCMDLGDRESCLYNFHGTLVAAGFGPSMSCFCFSLSLVLLCLSHNDCERSRLYTSVKDIARKQGEREPWRHGRRLPCD